MPIIVGVIFLFSSFYVTAFSLGGIFGPKMTIFIKFKDPGPLPEAMEIFYKGVRVGKITKMSISDDYKHSVLTAVIRKKNFNPPNNIHAEIKIQGEAKIWAQGVDITKYVDLIYPRNPSSTPLKEGDAIEGMPGDIERIQEFLKENIDQEDVKKSVDNVKQIMENTEEATQKLAQITDKINKFLDRNQQKLDEIVENINTTTANASSITLTAREFSDKPIGERGLRSTLDGISQITENIGGITTDVRNITGNKAFQCEITRTPADIRGFLSAAESTIKNLDREVNVTLNDVNRAINRYDCFGACLSDMLSKRFLAFKLLFGKPGEAFEVCRGPCPPNYSSCDFYRCPASPKLRPYRACPVYSAPRVRYYMQPGR